MADWYAQKRLDLNQDMASACIQEIFSWFGAYEEGHLDGETAVFSEKVFEAIALRKNHEAHQLIERVLQLAEMNNDYRQTREVLVLCGTAKYMLGSTHEAIGNFSEAILKLEPKSQGQAVAYWLNGISQWRIPQLLDQGLINLKRALEQFKDLRVKADQKHLAAKVQWYDEKMKIMQSEIEKRQKEMLNF